MYSHEPEGYNCPFCTIANGGNIEAPWTNQDDVVYRTHIVTAFIGAAWWTHNPGHVIVIPNQHIENIYVMPAETAAHLHEASRQIAIAFKQVYRCDGTSTRQHNEPAGYQEIWHYHTHVFPRYENDELYGSERRITTPDERLPYAEKLRKYFNGSHP